MNRLFRSEVLQRDQLYRLLDHRYKSTGVSFVEPIFQPFWRWTAKHVPLTVAPNTLTLTGLISNVIPILLLLYYSPNFKDEIPAFPILLFAFGIFIYMTLDALDGLHARRTNTCSHLGEMFDHGCDAISMYLLPLAYFAIIGLGDSPTAMFIEFFILNSMFYTYQWQSFVSGCMSFDSFSVSESIMFAIVFSMLSAIFGVDMWRLKDPLFGLQLNRLQFLIVVLGSIVLFSRAGQSIAVDGSGKYGTTVANTSVLFPVWPLLLIVGSAVFVFVRSPSQVYMHHPCLFLMCFGAVMAKISQNLVIAHMTKTGIRRFDTVMFGPLSLLVNLYFDCPVNEHWLLWAACIWSTFDMLYFCVRISIQVAGFLQIHIFRVPWSPNSRSHSAAPKSRPVSSTIRPQQPMVPTISAASLRSHTRRVVHN